MTWFRSLLYVPGNRPGWPEKAVAAGPDCVILDLEDSVPDGEKQQARELVGEVVRGGLAVGSLAVRINGVSTSLADEDLSAVVHEKLDAVLLPKIESIEDLNSVDRLISDLERERRMPRGRVKLVPVLETAWSIRATYAIVRASSRVSTVIGGGGPGADTNRSLGYTWTREGLETLYFRSKINLDARAAGVDYPIASGWLDIGDLDGFADEVRAVKGLGFRGYAVIHPSHVAVANEGFTPSSDEIKYWQEILQRMAEAKDSGRASSTLGGGMVDTAHVRTAQDGLAMARHLGLIGA